MNILLAGDGFLTEDLLAKAVRDVLPGAQLTSISSSWPVPPFHDIAEVQEALGDEDELIASLQGCEVAFTHTFPFTKRVIEASPQLRLIAVGRGGPVNINVDAATRSGILVANTPGRNASATAEHTVGMILAAARQIPARHIEVKEGLWRADYYRFENTGLEIGSITVGIVGLGAVGSRVAKIMAAFGGRILVFDPLAPRDPVFEYCDSLEDLLAACEIVTLHARVTQENRRMINPTTLSLMRPGAILVNCARGPLVDYDAVCDSLDDGHLGTAAFDCLPEEPLSPTHRLLRTPRIIFSPHIAGASQEAARFAARVGASNIASYAMGKIPPNVLNPEALSIN